MSISDEISDASVPPGRSKSWNYHPELPLKNSPLFSWPPKPMAVLAWFARNWVVISANVVSLVLALGIWILTLPEIAAMKTLSWDWILQIVARNYLLTFVVAGGMHLYLYSFAAQENEQKYDRRPMQTDNGVFTFRDQVHDNMFWTLVSGVPIWCTWEVLYWWAAANGYAPILTFSENPVWIATMILLTPMWISFHFYWIHRTIHLPWLYKYVHSLHHRNINVGPWSGLSMHPVEHVIFYSSVAIHFALVSHPVNFLYHMIQQNVGPIASHSGFDHMIFKGKEAAKTGIFFHQLHHRYFECNYGTNEMPWDRWFGSFHNGTPESHQRFQEKRRQMMLEAQKGAGYGSKQPSGRA